MSDEPDDELPSGAIRMMAFGVFVDQSAKPPLFMEAEPEALEHERLVVAEFKAHGWSLKKESTRRGTAYLLLGNLEQRGSFKTRPIIGRGTLAECCRGAVEYLDHPKRPTHPSKLRICVTEE